jgi:hypothetical protein
MTYYCTIEKEGDEYIAQFPDMTNIRLHFKADRVAVVA